MFMYKNINYFNCFILVLSLTVILTGCGGGASSQTSEKVTSTFHQGKITDYSTNKPLAGVSVTLGDLSTTTDAEGNYELTNLNESQEAVINFSKNGYQMGSKTIQIKNTSSNYLEYKMYKHDYQWNVTNLQEVSSTTISINPDTNINKTSSNSNITLQLTIHDNSEDALLDTFPGHFEGISANGVSVKFITYGLITFLMNDVSGNALNLDEGETATLTFKGPSYPDKPDLLPLWYYDYEQALWFEEGYAQLQEDGTYVGEVSQLGTWSLNQPLETEPGIYRGYIVDENGLPMGNVRVSAKGKNWVSHDLSTDENGLFEIEVIPESSYYLSAYNYKDKYGATYNTQMAEIASGDIIEE